MSAPVIGGFALNFEMSQKAIKYTPERLEADLAAGVASIIAGAGNDYVLTVNPTNVVAAHKNTVYAGTVAPGLRGNGQTGLGITASGMFMGYNDPVTGVWKDAIAITSTGNVTISGTLTASSVISGSVTVGSKTMDEISAAAFTSSYTAANLQADLAAGVNNIVAAVTSTSSLTIGSNFLIISEDGCTYNTTVGAYSGNLKSGIACSAGGIFMGYNRKSDGAWVTTMSLDATTGNASFTGAITATSGSFTGTINAASIIANTVQLSDGTTLATIKSGAAAGATAVQPASLAGMLTSSSSYVLAGDISVTNAGNGIKTGTITWDGTGTVTGGSGVAITSKGIVGASSGSTTFSINGTTGAAIFNGTITASQVTSGTFTGISVNTTGSISSSGVTSSGTIGNCSIYSIVSGAGYVAVGGVSSGGAGVYGRTSAASYAGVYGESTISTGKGVWAVGTNALEVTGGMYINNSNTVPYLSASYLEGHNSSYFLAAGATAYDTSRVGGSLHTNIPKYAGSITAAGETHGGLTTYWATFNVGGVNYKFLIAS